MNLAVRMALFAASAAAFAQNGEVPQLNVRVWNIAHVPPWNVSFAEHEAGRMLRYVHIHLNWLDCKGSDLPACSSPELPTDLTLRIQPKEPPGASPGDTGRTVLQGDLSVAFVFYDRVLALRSNGAPSQTILGRVMAHEITHVLLPREAHSGTGLMKDRWYADDLQFASPAYLGLPPRLIHLMEQEAFRRAEAARKSRPGSDPPRQIARSVPVKPVR